MDASALEYERVMEKKKQLLIKIQETKTGIRNKQNQLKILEEGLQKIKDQEGKESVGGKLNIFLRDFSVILEAMRTEKAFMETKYATQSAQIYYRVEKSVLEDYIKRLSEIDISEFMDYCKQLGFIRTEGKVSIFQWKSASIFFTQKNN